MTKGKDITIKVGGEEPKGYGPGGVVTIEPDYNVRQHDAAILRETLAKLCQMSPPHIQDYIKRRLSEYARAVEPYCLHPQKSHIPHEDAHACLDCGKRFPIEKIN